VWTIKFEQVKSTRDIDTRWNLTYKMLHRVFPYKHAISEILRNSPQGLPLLCSTKK
jgi:hypothetical protein